MDCYLCGSTNVTLITEKLRYDYNMKAYKCENCSLYFLYPKMTPEEENAFYEKEYGKIYRAEKNTSLQDLFESRFNSGDVKLYYELTKPYLSKEDNCFEAGAACGYFLAKIKNDVKLVSGSESHIEMREYADKIGIKMVESLSDVQENSIDKFFMFFLLEHLGNPIVYLKTVYRLLKKGGKLFILVPNVDDALFTVYKIPGFVSFYFTPAHPHYFSKKTLSEVIKKSGFDDFEVQYLQRYDLSNHMCWLATGKPGGLGKYSDFFTDELLSEYSRCLISHGNSDTLWAVVTK